MLLTWMKPENMPTKKPVTEDHKLHTSIYNERSEEKYPYRLVAALGWGCGDEWKD